MTGTALVRPAAAITWELRGAWATGHRISVTLEGCDTDRVEGTVRSVSATGATARIGGLWFPLDRVLAVHKPSRLGDSKARTAWASPPPAVLNVNPAQGRLDDAQPSDSREEFGLSSADDPERTRP